MFSKISLLVLFVATAQADYEQGRSLRGVSKPDDGNLFADERAKPAGSGGVAVGLLDEPNWCHCYNPVTGGSLAYDCGESTCSWCCSGMNNDWIGLDDD
mmetsp:Transcript_17595/g.24956  ORF Transcript_17595/g.24956 Transcript_17595/m.24956 type:complete len:99 (+) Transcript_17595:171-467(+)